MSTDFETYVVQPGNTAYREEAWALKERVRREEGVLAQPRAFFETEYRRSTVYLLLSEDRSSDLLAFGILRPDDYLSVLAVAPECQREGLGSHLVVQIAEDADVLTCHTRADNEAALEFYDDLGFDARRRIEAYYPDGSDAYFLRLDGEGEGAA